MLPVRNSLLPTVSKFFDEDWANIFDWSDNKLQYNLRNVPPVNITEENDHFILELAAPGMKKDDFNIEIRDNILYIRSMMESERETEEKNYTMKEFSYRRFERSFNLNNKIVDESEIDATYKDGILRLEIAKREEAKEKPPRTIKIS